MNKKIIVSIVVVIVVLVSFFVYKKVQAPSLKEQADVVNATAQSSVSTSVGKTNPFNVDVNPYQGYKNPFQ